ncbi:hypothetical protein ACROYT_G003135 [Oculina patagonica]
MMDLIHSFMFVAPADLILMILNLVIFCRVKRRKKEIARRKRETTRAGKMKVRRQKKRIRDVRNDKVVQFTDEAREMLSSKSSEPGGEVFAAESSNTETFIEMSTESNKGSDTSDVAVGEEDASSSTDQSVVEIAVDIYAAIKPGIYPITDKEFRERYKQFLSSPAAVLGRYDATQCRNKWELQAVFLAKKAVCEHRVADSSWSALLSTLSS